MSESPLKFDAAEAQLIARAAEPARTRRRLWLSALAPLALVAFALATFWRDAQPRLLLWLFVAYVLATLLERVSYGLAVLSYKRVIRKLLARVEELEVRST